MKNIQGLFFLRTIIPVCAGMTVLFITAPAYAQYITYSKTNKPSVEMNIDVLDSIPDSRASRSNTIETSEVPLPFSKEDLPAPSLKTPHLLKPLPAALLAEQKQAPRPEVQKPAHKAKTVPALSEDTPVAALVLEPADEQEPIAEQDAPYQETPVLAPAENFEDVLALDGENGPAVPAEDFVPVATETEEPIADNALSAPSAVPAKSDLSLLFEGNNSEITPEIEEKLSPIFTHMKDMPDLRLQVRAYASGEEGNRSSARRISLSRALSVRAWLMDQGIKPIRVDVRALGTETDQNPVDRVDLVFVP